MKCSKRINLVFFENVGVLFAPKRALNKSNQNVSFASAIQSIKTQRIARITKTALYILSAASLAATIVLAEGAFIAWPVTLSATLVIALASGIFYRLNKLDQTYLDGLTDDIRRDLFKNELSALLNQDDTKEIAKKLKQLNTLIGREIFSTNYRKNASKGIFEPLELNENWKEKGRFALDSFDYKVSLKLTGNANDEIVFSFKKSLSAS